MNVRLQLAAGGSKGVVGPQAQTSRGAAVFQLNSMAKSEARIDRAVRRHLPLVWRVLRRSGLRQSDADDAAQDVFWVLSQRITEVPEIAERSFLVATALRVSSERRRTRWYRSVTEPLDADVLTMPDSCPENQIEAHRRLQLLDEVLEQIDSREREVFILAVVEEMTKSEIAAALEIPEGTVASRLHRAKATFASTARKLHTLKGRLL